MSDDANLAPIYNLQTGEQVPDVFAALPERSKRRRRRMAPPIHKRWGLVDFSVASRADLTGTEFRVLFAVARELDRENERADVSVAKIADVTGLNHNTAYAALRRLILKGVIIRLTRGLYRINPEFLSRNSVRDWDEQTYAYRNFNKEEIDDAETRD